MDIAILGAGVAGLMSAITLRACGHRCRVFERNSQSQEAGMGFILVPEAIDSLRRFGVCLSGDFSGTPLELYNCRDSAGVIVSRQVMPEGSLGIRRRDLILALMLALDDEVVTFADLEKLEFDDHFHVTAATLRSESGVQRVACERVTADLFIGAEGVNSRARQALFPDWPATPDRISEFVGLVECDKAAQWAGHNLNKFHSAEGGVALGILPVDSRRVVWYLQFDSLRFPLPGEILRGEAHPDLRRAFIERMVAGWGPPVPALIAKTDFAKVHLWRPIETDLIPQFHRGNVVLVGDAAHPLSPFTSQGVASALDDAIALAEALSGAESPRDLSRALESYSQRQHAQCASYALQGREMAERFLEPLSETSATLPIARKAEGLSAVTRATQRSFAQEA